MLAVPLRLCMYIAYTGHVYIALYRRPAGNSLDVCHVGIGADTSNITNTVSTFAGKRLI